MHIIQSYVREHIIVCVHVNLNIMMTYRWSRILGQLRFEVGPMIKIDAVAWSSSNLNVWTRLQKFMQQVSPIEMK